MIRPTMIRACLILLTISAEPGCRGKDQFDASREKTQVPPQITPEQARAALLKLDKLPRYSGGESDPIHLDLKNGAVARLNDSRVTIGKFFSIDLKKKSWEMSFHIRVAPVSKMNFSTGANGKFEFTSDGTWRAIIEGRYIT